MRLSQAPTSALTDARGHYKKAHRSSLAAERQAVVSLPDKATGAGVISTHAGHDFNASGLTDTSKRASSLSLRWPHRSRYGAFIVV
jgi:hypothetical protein